MNKKISSGEVFPIEVGLMVALFPGFANNLILSMSKNASLLSVLIAFVIGFIPILMIVLISKKIKTQSLKEYLNTNLGFFGKLLNILLIVVAIFILFLSSWLTIDFMISQFLTRTSYYFIAIIFFSIITYAINKGIETMSRSIFILFIITVPLMVILWCFLIPYIDLNNLKPYIDVGYNRIIKSSTIYLTYTTLPVLYILDLKHITSDKKNFERKLIISYIMSSFIIFVFLFLIISVYSIDLAEIFTYPVYSLFKKVQVLGFIERIENFAAVQIIVSFYIEATYLIYYLKENISSLLRLKRKKKNILTYLIAIIIPIISISIFKNYNMIHIVNISPYVLSALFIIIIIVFFISLNKKED
jgi:spore germination protein KB